MISTVAITLGDALKWAGIVPTGGQAKRLVRSGHVLVNGIVEHRRGRRVVPGDHITVRGREFCVVAG